ncbi:MAG: acyltransferase [Candidatus Caenarcaniphilales bacterium]|nr:acyltransferase [Candidatus Caenarcaniphilales bacterium]
MEPKNFRFEVLDCFRGIFALIVALFHFDENFQVLFPGYLAVDFFLILSGFVLSHRYLFKETPVSIPKFIVNRFARLYPLHVFSLLVFLLFNYWAWQFNPFEAKHSILKLFQNLTLSHIIGHTMIWNYPSWSVSVEFWVNMVFIFYINKFTKAHNLFFLALLGYIVLYLHFGHLDVIGENVFNTFSAGFLRGLNGFFLGIIAYRIYLLLNQNKLVQKTVYISIIELLSLSFITFVALNREFYRDSSDFIVPFIFLFALPVFAFEKGVISKILRFTKLKYLGLISYSIYLNHLLVIEVLRFFFGHNFVYNKEIYIAIYFIALITYSTITYLLIEKLFIKLIKNFADKQFNLLFK